MSLTDNTQNIIDRARKYIPDAKDRTSVIRGEEIGRTALPTGTRETFYVKQSPIGSVYLYVEPYTYSPVSTLSGLSSSDKKFLWDASTLSCIFPDGSSDVSYRPNQYLSILANYEYTEQVPYMYSNNELVGYLSSAISYLNNVFGYSYSYTGTVSSFEVGSSGNDDKELISRSLAIVVRKSFVEEQMHKGLGVKFKGPMQSIDSVAQMKEYNKTTLLLEKSIKDTSPGNSPSNLSEIIDIYKEEVVNT